jgi:hypothetical protein
MNIWSLPRGKSQHPRKYKGLYVPPKDKHARWRLKCRLQGRCTHCGKPCAPYATCQERRDYNRMLANRHRNNGICIVFLKPKKKK